MVLYGNEAELNVVLPTPTSLRVSVEAIVWPASSGDGYVYGSDDQFQFGENSDAVTVPLAPGALNHITLRARGASPAELFIDAHGSTDLVPSNFTLLRMADVTQADLDAELKKMIDVAKKVSKELGEFLDFPEGVNFDDVDQTCTGKIKPDGGNTKENTRIRISRKQWRGALAEIEAETDEEKRAALVKKFFREFLEQLLHEASHRKGIVDGKADFGSPAGEEMRNTEALIKRLIELIEKLKGNKPLDDGEGLKGEPAAEWIERLRQIVHDEKLYRWEKGTEKHPWPTHKRRVTDRWNDFKEELEKIKKSKKSAAKKAEAAAKAHKTFTDKAGADKAKLEKAFDIDWTLDWDRDTLEPIEKVKSTDKFDGKAIP